MDRARVGRDRLLSLCRPDLLHGMSGVARKIPKVIAPCSDSYTSRTRRRTSGYHDVAGSRSPWVFSERHADIRAKDQGDREKAERSLPTRAAIHGQSPICNCGGWKGR